MGRTSTARERLVDSACTLIHERGYASIGVAEICARADVRKGSFYHFFDAKQTLTIAVIDRYWAAERTVWTTALGADVPAVERIDRLLESQVRAQRETRRAHGQVRGCLLGNLAAELSTTDAALRARLAEAFDEQAALMLDTLTAAEAEAAVPPGTATPDTARAVLAQLEGLVLFAKLRDDPSVLDDLAPQVHRLIGAR